MGVRETADLPLTEGRFDFWCNFLRQEMQSPRYTLSVCNHRHMQTLLMLQYMFDFTDDEAGIDGDCAGAVHFVLDHFRGNNDDWSFDRASATALRGAFARALAELDTYLATERPEDTR